MRLPTRQIEMTKQEAKQYSGATRHARGFTIAELITIIVIAGILAAVAVPRFFDRNTFDSRGFYDQVISTLRYAQKAAIAQHRFVCVSFPANNRVALTQVATGGVCPGTSPGNNLASPSGSYPAGQTTYTVDAPSGISLSGYADFYFDALGKPSFVTAPSITVSGYATHIIIELETGYVH